MVYEPDSSGLQHVTVGRWFQTFTSRLHFTSGTIAQEAMTSSLDLKPLNSFLQAIENYTLLASYPPSLVNISEYPHSHSHAPSIPPDPSVFQSKKTNFKYLKIKINPQIIAVFNQTRRPIFAYICLFKV